MSVSWNCYENVAASINLVLCSQGLSCCLHFIIHQSFMSSPLQLILVVLFTPFSLRASAVDIEHHATVNYVIQCCRLIFPSASSSPPPSICLIALNPECVFCAVSSICRAVRVGDGRGCKRVCAAVLHHALLLPALRMTLY